MQTIRTASGDLIYFQFASLGQSEGLLHGVSGRLGGMGIEPFATLNLSYAVGDDPGVVAANRDRLCAALGFEPSRVVGAEQVHGSLVARVGWAEAGRGYRERASAIRGADALVTDEPGLVLWLGFADCVPLLFHDPVRRAVGIAHAGWRGTLAGVASQTVEALVREFGSRPSDLLVGIGPSIGPCCYEVGGEVVETARSVFAGEPDSPLLETEGRWRLDLRRANAILLARSGVDPERVETTEYCTACRPDLFFSHRAERGRTGRFAAVIGLRRESV